MKAEPRGREGETQLPVGPERFLEAEGPHRLGDRPIRQGGAFGPPGGGCWAHRANRRSADDDSGLTVPPTMLFHAKVHVTLAGKSGLWAEYWHRAGWNRHRMFGWYYNAGIARQARQGSPGFEHREN